MFDQAEPEWWANSYAPGKWRRAEVLGHLIDSAAHNHLRLARCLSAPGQHLEAGYDQEALVAAQNYAETDPATLAALWLAYNRLLLSIAVRLTPAQLDLPCLLQGDAERDTVGRLLVDYVEHLDKHWQQLWPNR